MKNKFKIYMIKFPNKFIVFLISFFIGVFFNVSFDIVNVLADDVTVYGEYRAFYVYGIDNNDNKLYENVEFYITNDDFSTGIIVISTSKNIKDTSSYIDYSNYKIYDENNNLVHPVNVSTLSSIEGIQYDDFDSYNGLTQVYVLKTNKTYKLKVFESYLSDKFERGNFNIWIHIMYNGSDFNSAGDNYYAKIDFVKRTVFKVY